MSQYYIYCLYSFNFLNKSINKNNKWKIFSSEKMYKRKCSKKTKIRVKKIPILRDFQFRLGDEEKKEKHKITVIVRLIAIVTI